MSQIQAVVDREGRKRHWKVLEYVWRAKAQHCGPSLQARRISRLGVCHKEPRPTLEQIRPIPLHLEYS